MNEKELEQKRKEFKETEIQNKIQSYSASSATEYRQNSLKSNYTYKRVDKRLNKFSKVLIVTQAIFLCLFSSLYVASYIPKTKFIVAKVMP